jgi:vancomycin permeability regulator SanA
VTLDGPVAHVGRPRRRRALRLLGALIALIALYLGTTFIDVWLASRQSYDGYAPAAVVLGAAQYNGEPSPVLRGRLDRAAALYFAGQVDIVVVTGGGQAGDLTTEAKASYDYLRANAGIPDEQLRLEVDGTSTYESLTAAGRFLQREGITEITLVTDPYHARRAALVAEANGFTAHVAITDAPSSFRRLAGETGAVAIGRLVGFRRLDRF